MTIAIVIRIC